MAVKRSVFICCPRCNERQVRLETEDKPPYKVTAIKYSPCNCAAVPGPQAGPVTYRPDEVMLVIEPDHLHKAELAASWARYD